MVSIYLRGGNAGTMASFLDEWVRPGVCDVQVIPYDYLARLDALPTGTTIFADLDRLTPQELAIAAEVWRQLEAMSVPSGLTVPGGTGSVRLLNHPHRVLNRYELLRKLHEAGQNETNVYRLSECRTPERFPVFLREIGRRGGLKTPLIETQVDLDQVVLEAIMLSLDPDDVMIAEYCDLSDENGIHHAHSAYRIGDSIIPGELSFGRAWLVNEATREPGLNLDRRHAFVRENPHADQIRAAFEVANIEYGSIEYGVRNGVIQVWDINTNPRIAQPKQEVDPAQRVEVQDTVDRVAAGFAAIDTTKPAARAVPIDLSAEKLSQCLAFAASGRS